MRLEFGTLQRVCGNAVNHGGYTFVPAEVKLAGNGFSTGFHLADAASKPPPEILANPIEAQYDAAWVRARLPRVFGFVTEDSDVEKSLLNVGFVAVSAGNEVGFPFICTDYYGRTGLIFSPDGPNPETQSRLPLLFGRFCCEIQTVCLTFLRKSCIWAQASGCTTPAKMVNSNILSRRTNRQCLPLHYATAAATLQTND
jgi:hypothetical protein